MKSRQKGAGYDFILSQVLIKLPSAVFRHLRCAARLFHKTSVLTDAVQIKINLLKVECRLWSLTMDEVDESKLMRRLRLLEYWQAGSRSISLACGSYQSIFVDTHGKLWVWGAGKFGQLGNGSAQDVPYPIQLPLSRLGVSVVVTSVSCGCAHSAFTTSDHRAFTFGDGRYWQLGLGSDKMMAMVPQHVQLPQDCLRVSCGPAHTIFICADGTVYTCGLNAEGRLGIGDHARLSELMAESSHDSFVLAHHGSVRAVARPQQLLGFGSADGEVAVLDGAAGISHSVLVHHPLKLCLVRSC
jgi:alpha-tubulin suppressor-like RCC1 family protein